MVKADIDAKSLSGFMSEPSSVKVPRRLAPPVNTLDYFLDYLQGLEKVYTQQTGVVNVNGVQVKAITQAVKDALNSAAIDNNTQVDTLITATPQYVGAVARSLAEVNSDNVSIKSFMSSSKSENQALRDALQSGVDNIQIPKDVILEITENITITNPIFTKIHGEGTLRFSGAGQLNIVNPITELTPTSGQEYSGVNSLSFSSTSNIERGDVIIVWNPDDFSFSGYRSYYRDGYMMQAAKIVGNTVRFYGRTPAINSSNIRAWVMRKKHITIDGLNIEGSKLSTNLVVKHFTSVNARNLRTDGLNANTVNMQINKCFNVTVDSSALSSSNDIAYPVSINNCQDFKILGCSNTTTRHSVQIGGDGLDASVPCRNGFISHCHLYNDPIGVEDTDTSGGGTTAGDGHGICANITWSECVFNMGAAFGGRDCNIYDSDIYSVDNPDAATTISGVEIDKGMFRLHRCNLYVSRRTSEGYRSAIIRTSCAKRSGKINFDIKDISIHWLNAQAPLGLVNTIPTFLVMDNPDTTDDMYVNIDKVTEFDKDFDQLFVAQIFDNTVDNGQKYYISMSGIPNKGYLNYFNNPKPYELFHIIGESGRDDITVDAGTEATATPINKQLMRMPKTPSVDVRLVGSSTAENRFPSSGWGAFSRAAQGSNITQFWAGAYSLKAGRVASETFTLPLEWTVYIKDF